ncbi:hypothetical protein ARALYDRAFT_891100 [Arabidopsis lyrata subsp. lyrata]|uniref:Uncharacterized protein n=2 Tax=Arabidopsis lyrata subsp. lyrata TaxID=81972 RepID=D7KKB1_ARALL|nr:hypothetical protein ARALYDRAFT_891100 [Arabidopsis lyrata subsp. lyrata]
MNLSQNQQEPVQYQALVDFNNQIQHGISDMNLNQNMTLDTNQYPFQHEPCMNMLMEYPHQDVGYVGFTVTGHMPSTTTNVYVPYINNHL